MVIRPERPDDQRAIYALTASAFAPMPFSNGSEPAIIDRLREDGDLTVSLVAVIGDEIVGHIALSPVLVGNDGDGWFGLGPVSVLPARQGEGVGTALIEEGLSILKAMGAKGCVLIGSPKLYARFGFSSDCGLTYRDVPAQYVQSLEFRDIRPVGPVKFTSAFER